MDNNKFWLKIIGLLDKVRSKREIKKNLKELGDFHVSVIPKIGKTKAKAQIKKDLTGVTATVNADIKVDGKKIQIATKKATEQAQEVANKNAIQVSANVDLKKSKLINDIKVFGKENSKMLNDMQMSSKYSTLLNNAKLATSNKEIKNLRLQLSALKSELKATGMSGLSFGDSLKKTFKRVGEYFISTGGMFLLTQQTRQAWQEALELDEAYTDLIKVQDELTRGDYPEYLERCNEKAQELATTQKAIIEGVTEFSRSGYNLTESNQLAEQANILANVGDMTASDSSKAIISGVQAYEEVHGYTDTIDKAIALIDSYNAIGNTASITSAELAEGVQAVGAVFADSNTSVDEFIALLAAGNRQFQNADTLALGLRTAALRLRSCTTELALLGEETEGVYESTSKLQEKIEGLTNINGNGGVKLLEDDGETFRSIYDIFLDISKVYKDMSDTDQSALLSLIAGTHRASAISATLNNMSEAQEIYERSLASAGSAQEEYNKYLESSEASLNRFKASMTETYQSVISGETVTGILSCANATLQFVNGLGLVESSLKGIIAIKIVKAVTMMSASLKASAIQASKFGTALKTVNNMSSMTKGTKEYADALQSLKTSCTGLTEKQLKQVLSNKSLDNSTRIAILRTNGLSKAQAQARLNQMNLTKSTKAQTLAQNTATASTFSLSAAVKGFAASTKAAFMSNPIGIGIMAISTVIGAVSSKMSEYNEKLRETRQAQMDAADTAKEKADSLKEVYIQYEKLSNIADKTVTEEEDYKQVILEITKALGGRAEALDGLKVGTDEYTKALREATKAELENQYATAKVGAKAAEDALKDVTYDAWTGSQITVPLNLNMTGVKEHVAALNEVRDILAEFEDVSGSVTADGTYTLDWEPVNWDSNRSDMNAVVEYYNALVKARTKLVTSDNADFLMESDIYENISKTIDLLSESVEKYTEQQYNALRLNYEWKNGIPRTEEEFRKMEQSILDASGAGETFKETLKDYLTQDYGELLAENIDVSGAIENNEKAITVLAETQIEKINEYQEKLNTLYEALNLLQSGVMTPKDIDALIDKFPELSDDTEDLETAIKSLIDNALLAMGDVYGSLLDNVAEFAVKQNAVEHSISTTASAIDSITSAYQSLNKAIEEYNENGYVSLDTLKQMMTMQPQYLQALVDEKGNLLANAEAYKKLLILKLDEWRLDIHRKQDLEREEHAEEIKKLTMQYNGGEITAEEWKKRYNEITDGDYYQATIDAINSIHMNIDKVLEDIGSGGSGSSASKSKNTLDWLTVSLDNLNEKVNDFQNELKNADGIEVQKKAINSLNKELQKLQNTYYSYDDNSNTVYGEYQKRYNEALSKLGKDSSSIKSKIETETVFDTQEFSAEVAKIVNEAIDAWNGMKDSHNKYLEIGVQIDENLDKAYDLELKKILGDFDNAISHFENQEKLINSKLSNAEANGIIALEAYYKELQKVENSTYEEIKKNQAELNRLMEESNLEKGSDEWHNLQNEIEEANIAMQDSINNIAELDKKLREIRWDRFDFSREQESLLIDEADFLTDLLDKSDAYDEIGNITNEGLAKMGLYAANYNAYMEQSIKYTLELKEVQKELEKAPTDTKLMDRYNELVERQREAILSSESLKESMVNLVNEGIDLNKSAMRDLIDSYLEAGESARDLYNWQKRSAESTKRIASIQKQLSVYSGQDTEEARMMTQKLKLQLEEETSNYEEQLMEKHLEDQREILNALYDNYEIALNNYLSDTARVVSDSIDRVNDSNGIINDTIKTEAEKVGVEISDEMKDIWSKEDSVLSDGFEGVADNVDKNTGVLEAFDTKMEALLREMESAIDLQLDEVTGDTEAMSGQLGGINDKATSMSNSLQNITNQLDTIVGKMDKGNSSDGSPATPTVGGSTGAVSGSVTFKSKKSSYDKSKLNTDTSLVDLLKYHDFDSSKSARADYYSQMGFEDVYKDTPTQNIAMLEWLKRNGYKANEYASGGKNLSKQLAWTQENGELEYIIRPSDGAILTPVPQNGMVLNSEASKRLWEMTNNPTSFFADIVKGGFAIDIPKSTVANNNHVDVQLNAEFVLPNARTYGEIVTQMQHDEKFEKMIQDMIGSSLGNANSFRKYRHTFK